MSKLHVNQIAGYLSRHLTDHIDMGDCTGLDELSKRRTFLSRALGALAVANVVGSSLEDVASHVTDGTDDGGIDLVYFDPTGKTLYLAQSKWHESGHGSIELGDALKFIQGARNVLDNDLTSFNGKVQGNATDIESALYDASARFVLLICHTGQEQLSGPVRTALDKYIASQNDTSELIRLEIWSQRELHRAVALGVAGSPIAVELQLQGWAPVREPHNGLYGRVCATDVANWYMTHGDRLFNSNLRHFLGTSHVNQDLIDTLVSRPEEFWYFNNGITALTTNFAKKPIGGNSTDTGFFECEGFSIVNGAQTVGSIAAAHQQAPERVAGAVVPIRIIQVADQGTAFAGEVTRYTNTQNSIEKRDFVALDPEQERLRQQLLIEGVEYNYKAGSQSSTASKRFDLLEATVALACSQADVALAVQAKREIGKLWDDISKSPYKQLFHPGVTGPALWEAVQIHRKIDSTLQDEQRDRNGRDRLVCVHGNRFVQWLTYQALSGMQALDAQNVAATATKVAADRLIAEVKVQYPDAYPASLFKNLAKCRSLAAALTIGVTTPPSLPPLPLPPPAIPLPLPGNTSGPASY
jgi:hypothetical protein